MESAFQYKIFQRKKTAHTDALRLLSNDAYQNTHENGTDIYMDIANFENESFFIFKLKKKKPKNAKNFLCLTLHHDIEQQQKI